MSTAVKINTQIVNNIFKVEFIGNIDEDVNFEKVLSVKMPEYHFDFQKVKLINSCGVREWIKFIENLGPDVKISYYNCGQIVVEQINMVHGFVTDTSQIKTIYTPYFCEKCDKEKHVLVETNTIQNKKAPVVLCDGCNSPMEFDAIEEQFFGFIKE